MITVDAHMDIPWIIQKYGPRDLTKPSPHSIFTKGRAKEGRLSSGIFALYLSDSMQDDMTPEQILLAIRKQYDALTYQTAFAVCHSSSNVTSACNLLSNSFIYMTALEGGRLLCGQLGNVEFMKQHYGIQYLTLLHNRDNDLGDSTTGEHSTGGLTDFGKQVVAHCDFHKIKVDISHSSDATVWDVFDASTKPVLATHSGYRSLVNHPRNITKQIARNVVATGGFIGVPFAKRFIGHYSVMEHVAGLADAIGNTKHIGIGSDIDGAVMIPEVKGVEDWGKVVMDDLSAAGYSDEAVAAIAGGNLLRVLTL